MIHIAVGAQELLDLIEAESPGWMTDAKKRAKKAKQDGKVGKSDGTWSKIKAVFIRLQHHKCAYCEKPMAKTTSGSAEKVAVDYDVEHFRPKNRVTAWPRPADVARRPAVSAYAALVRMGSAAGYVRFAFDPFNYVVSCKVCNTQYKADRFPIAGTASQLVDRAKLDAKERPLLLFPIGDGGDDPKDYLQFTGAMIQVRPGDSARRLRANAVIDFFELDTREDLIEGRCMLLTALFPNLEARVGATTAARRERAKQFVRRVSEDGFPHAGCSRAFVELFDTDPALAQRLHDAAQEYLITKDAAALALDP